MDIGGLSLADERWNGHSGPEDLLGVDDLLGSFRWYEALCINQEDVEERNSQVAMMGSIYANASMVLIWLGEADPDSTEAIHHIWRFGSAIQKEFKDPDHFPLDFPALEFNDAEVYNELQLEPITTAQWHSILRLFTKRWFTRGWVMQEFILARKAIILYDMQQLESEPLVFFTIFVLASGWINNMTIVPGLEIYQQDLGLRQMGSAINYSLYKTERPELQTCRPLLNNMYQAHSQADRLYAYLQILTIHTRPRQVGDLRDKVFAPLALTTHFVPETLKKSESFEWMKPDYTLSTEDAYAEFASFLIRHSRSLDFLSFVSDRSVRKLEGLPSWVPDLSTNGASPLVTLIFSATHHWNIVKHTAQFLDSRTLKVTAYLPDEVVEVAPPMEDIIKLHKVIEWFKLLCNLGSEGYDDSTNQPFVEMLWRTLIADLETEPYNPDLLSDLAISFRSYILLEMTGAFMDSQKQNIEPTIFWDSNTAFTTIASTYPDALPSPEGIVEAAQLSISNHTPHPLWTAELAPLTDFQNRFWTISKQRRLVRTKKGCLGLAPASTEVGDVIGFFQGAKSPFVLRRKERDEEGKWELIGEVYVHGYMRGEIVRWGDPTWEDVILV